MAKVARNRPTSVRFSPEEFAAIEALSKATGAKIATLVRSAVRMAFAAPTQEEANIRGFAEISAELNRVGNNLNQLARRANSGSFLMTAADREHIASLQVEVRGVALLFEDYRRLAARRDLSARVAELDA